VQFIKENLTFIGDDTPMANLMLSVMGAFAEFERAIVEEYFATAEKLKSKLKREDRSIIDEILDMIVMRSHFGRAIVGSGPICRDPNDQMFLDLAVSVGVNYIVSGDKDILTVLCLKA
jgi:putative PIN family toxin of toxin-antitoxin system